MASDFADSVKPRKDVAQFTLSFETEGFINITMIIPMYGGLTGFLGRLKIMVS